MTETYQPLVGRHALVTGAGSGIGAATALKLHALGANVSLIGRDITKLTRTADSLADAVCVVGDVTDEASVDAAFTAARTRFGEVHILVNNAGAAASQPFLKTTRESFDAMLAVNLTGAFLTSKEALPDMVAARWGRIVNVASTAALKGYAYVAAYCAAKHGLLGLTRALALEVAKKGVTVNAVCPGFTDTDLVVRSVETITAKTGRSADEARAELAGANPQARLLTPGEIADTIAWLCLAESSGINGAAVPISGGEV